MLSKFLLRHGLVFRLRPRFVRREEREELDRGHWAWIRVGLVRRKADNEALAYYIDRVNQATEDQGPPGEAGGGRGVEAQVEEAGGLRPAA